MTTLHPLETLVHATPLIVACRDIGTGRPVTTGLRLTLTPFGGPPARPRAAFTTLSGAYAFENLPGIADLEFAEEGRAAWEGVSPAPGLPFALMVEDARGRYLPWGATLTLPRRDPLPAEMFAAPTAAPAPGLTLLRGALTDAARPLPGGAGFAPAAHAYVEARYAASTTSPPTVYPALADARGEFALLLPLPNPLDAPPGVPSSPSLPAGVTLDDLRWPVTMTFAYAPADQRFVCRALADGRVEVVGGAARPDVVTDARPGWRCVPEIRSLLTQGAATVSDGGAAAPAHEAAVRFAGENVLRTALPDRSLRLTPPVGSPP